MNIQNNKELVEQFVGVVDYLVDHEDDFYISLDLAYQLLDEIIRTVGEIWLNISHFLRSNRKANNNGTDARIDGKIQSIT